MNRVVTVRAVRGDTHVRLYNQDHSFDQLLQLSPNFAAELDHAAADRNWILAWIVAELDQTPRGLELVRLRPGEEPEPWEEVNPG